MAIGSGIASQVGISAATSSYGTYVAPTRFVRGRMYAVTRAAQRVQGEGITSGWLTPNAKHYVETTEAASAKIDFDVQDAGMGLLLQAIMGGTSTFGTTASAANTQTHTLGDPYGKSYTVQVGAPTRGGTVVPQTLTGGVVTSAKFSCDAAGLLQCTIDVDGRQFKTTQSLAVATYTPTGVFSGKNASLKMGTLGAETAVAGVRSVSLSISRSIDASDYTYNAAGLKSEPVLNGLYDVSGSIEVDWLDPALFQAAVINNTPQNLVWGFEGESIITGTTKPSLKFNLPSCYFEGDMQGVDGPKELTNTFNFAHKYDGTNLPSIVSVTGDVTL